MTPSSESTNSNNLESQSSAIKEGTQADDLTSPSATTPDIPSFGWSGYAERVNGRFAMVGFLAILLIEIFSHSGFLHWAGFVP